MTISFRPKLLGAFRLAATTQNRWSKCPQIQHQHLAGIPLNRVTTVYLLHGIILEGLSASQFRPAVEQLGHDELVTAEVIDAGQYYQRNLTYRCE